MSADFASEVAGIVAVSAVRNRARGVTGMLVTHEAWFIQTLEGARDTVVGLYEKIATDPRHEDVRLVSLEPVAERAFGAWGMRGGKAPSADAEQALTMTTLSAAGLLGLLQRGFEAEDAVEHGRLGALNSLAILDTLPERQFDDLVEVAKALAGAKIALISLVDAERQWFKAKTGLEVCETGRDIAFCDHAIRQSEVLWVEDAACRVIELILASLDADIASVENGAQAVEAFQTQAFDLVLMDMMMPVMDGLAATRAIRAFEAQHSLQRTPVLMLTANTLPEHVQAATSAGTDRYLPKPITAPQLLAAIGEELAADAGIETPGELYRTG